MNYYLTESGHIRSTTALGISELSADGLTQLTIEQVDLFINGNIPEGKQRKSGTLDIEDIPTSELILSEIAELESQQTPRRLREAALGDEDSIAFLQDIDDQISELRKSLSD